MLGSGWLLHGLGRLAPCAQLFGGRRGQPLFEQPVGLSMCEAAARSLCVRLDPADARAGRTRLCVSAGRHLLRLAIQSDHENKAKAVESLQQDTEDFGPAEVQAAPQVTEEADLPAFCSTTAGDGTTRRVLTDFYICDVDGEPHHRRRCR